MTYRTQHWRERRTQVIGQAVRDWIQTLDDVELDPKYKDNDPTQYFETAELLSASREDQDRLYREKLLALREAGLTTSYEERIISLFMA